MFTCTSHVAVRFAWSSCFTSRLRGDGDRLPEGGDEGQEVGPAVQGVQTGVAGHRLDRPQRPARRLLRQVQQELHLGGRRPVRRGHRVLRPAAADHHVVQRQDARWAVDLRRRHRTEVNVPQTRV